MVILQGSHKSDKTRQSLKPYGASLQAHPKADVADSHRELAFGNGFCSGICALCWLFLAGWNGREEDAGQELWRPQPDGTFEMFRFSCVRVRGYADIQSSARTPQSP